MLRILLSLYIITLASACDSTKFTKKQTESIQAPLIAAALPLSCPSVSDRGIASQSSQWKNGLYPAKFAIDGDINTFTHTDHNQAVASWRLDIPGNYRFEKVILRNRIDYESRLRDITLSVLDESGATVYQSVLLNPENKLQSPSVLEINFPTAIIGSTLMVTRTPDPDLSGLLNEQGVSEPNVLSLAEVDVFACKFSTDGAISWSEPVNTTGKHQLLEGDVVLALNGGLDVTVNNGGSRASQNYAFVGSQYDKLAFMPTTNSAIHTIVGSPSTGHENFDTLINTFSYTTSGVSDGLLTLDGLTPGKLYQIQIFYNDQRDDYSDRVMTFLSNDSQRADLQAKGVGWGQHVIGSFSATSTEIVFQQIANGFPNVHYSAILVVEVPSKPPELIWSAPVDTTGKEQLLEGDVFFAINGGPSVTVTNGGASARQNYSFAGSEYQSIDFAPATTSNIHPQAGSTSTGNLNFDALINSFAYSSSNIDSGRQTVNGLTPGHLYRVQIFYNDQRPAFNSRTMTYADASNAARKVDLNAAGVGWGQHAIGHFTATESSIELAHITNGFDNVHYNAILIIDESASDTEAVQVNIYAEQGQKSEYTTFYFTFSEDISGLQASDITVSNGTVQSISGEGRYYSALIKTDSPGRLSVNVNSGRVIGKNTGYTNALGSISIDSDFHTGESWIIDDQNAWLNSQEQITNLMVENGQVKTATAGTYSSTTRFFRTLQKVDTITFKQAPIWDHWIGVGNVGPSDARDAPVLLPLSDKNYYFLGLGNSGGYHAWHSTDMIDWEDRGPVTTPGDGRWVTSAEYKNGRAYIYSDAPNDLTPHLFIDDNLDDGIAGQLMGPVFTKQTCGSDASFFRNDTDGLFHIIYEDWSPINARENSWDSPLAGHASSADGLTGFEHHEHLPPVDHRTNPTGVLSSYGHPQIGSCDFEVHSPGQDAYGDWTTIKVGDQYYLFGDYDQHDEGIRVARFTSDSIYKEFELVGSLGNGHPDPTVGFAEGQFYLITQQTTDYVSPGPWVNGVQARVGVDISGNSVVDQWTDWQSIKESYHQRPGFARVVETTPAQVDVSALPAGFGFKFEFRLDNAQVLPASPIIDRVEMAADQLHASMTLANCTLDHSQPAHYPALPHMAKAVHRQLLLMPTYGWGASTMNISVVVPSMLICKQPKLHCKRWQTNFRYPLMMLRAVLCALPMTTWSMH